MSKDAVREAIKAARGTVSFSGRIGEPMIMTFEFQGGLSENSGASSQDAGNVTGITYTSQVPPVLLDADLVHMKSGTSWANRYGPCIASIDIAMANEIGFRECMADAAGIQETVLSGRTPTISIDPELVTEGTWSSSRTTRRAVQTSLSDRPRKTRSSSGCPEFRGLARPREIETASLLASSPACFTAALRAVAQARLTMSLC
jgi:hypothetical protein